MYEKVIDASIVPDFDSLPEEERLELISADYLARREALWGKGEESSLWLVDGMIMQGLYHLLVGRPQRGKSLLAEQLAVCVASGNPFLGKFKTKQGKVLLIDEDTPTKTLTNRLYRFANCIGKNLEKLPIEVRSMTGFRLDDTSQLNKLLQDVKGVELTILDCLNSIAGTWNYDRTSDASKINDIMNKLKVKTTPILVHHTSSKGVDDSEMCSPDTDFTKWIMGNTMLLGGCDTAFGMFNPSDNNAEFIFRTKPRREPLNVPNIFGTKILEDKEHSYLWLWFREPTFISEEAKDILYLWKDSRDRSFTIEEALSAPGKFLSDFQLRQVFKELRSQRLVRLRRGTRNLFRYSLTKKGNGLLEELVQKEPE